MVGLKCRGYRELKGGASSDVLIHSEYCFILYGRMRFDDVCLIFKLYVEM